MLIGHVTILLVAYGLFPKLSLFALLLGGGIPNLDAAPTLLRKKTPINPKMEFHGRSILHTPIFFLIIFPILHYFLGLVIAASLCLGGVIHILTDSLDDRGRMLLYPLSKKFYGLPILPYDFWTYTTNKKILAFEGVLLLIACILLLY